MNGINKFTLKRF